MKLLGAAPCQSNSVAGSDGDESTAARLSTSETFDDGKSLSPSVAGPLARAG